ncbi:MAG: hypothetical protein M1834_008460 [Cirrosporium novae-zelandiae]|nr:MAG: hypothetical protein M1834_008460 [Cirrosporium novae-zelandiae]
METSSDTLSELSGSGYDNNNNSDTTEPSPYAPKQVPPEAEQIFQDYIKRPIDKSYVPREEECLYLESTSATRTHASFGDERMTVTVSVYGELLRISRYIGKGGRSGMFSVGPADIPDPWFVVGRPRELQDPSVTPFVGVRLRLQGGKDLEEPKLEFLHDHWPRITYQGANVHVTVQLLIKDTFVLQQYTLWNDNPEKNKYKKDSGPNKYGFSLVHKFQEENLRLAKKSEPSENSHTSENEGEAEHKQETKNGQEDFADDHTPQDSTENCESQTPEAIGLIAGLFINDEAQKFDFGAKEYERKIQIPPKTQIELIGAYGLEHIVPNTDCRWEDRIISINDANVNKVLRQSTSSFGWASAGGKIDFIFRRTLEHIFSICSIPVGRNRNDPSIALICGDSGDHRVYVSGTLIRRTCKGHLKWTFEQATIEDGRFNNNYWVDGSIIKNAPSHPSNVPASMPSQLLKIFEYLKASSDEADFEFSMNMLNIQVPAWLKALNQTKNHITLAWKHSVNSLISSYRLDNHVWIWRAMKCLEDFFQDSDKGKAPYFKDGSRLRDFLARLKETPNYDAATVRGQILRRFTTENGNTKKRMLAVTRSSRQNRFLTHSRDTILFYKLKWGFFQIEEGSNSTVEVWNNLCEAQKDHEENQKLLWDNPLHSGLAILVGTYGHPMNRVISPSKLIRIVKSVLLRCSWSNGLFPGQIDEMTNELEIFDNSNDRDFYFHASFKIPCILLWQTKKSQTHKSTVDHSGTTAPSITLETSDERNPLQFKQPGHQPTKEFAYSELTLASRRQRTRTADANEWEANKFAARERNLPPRTYGSKEAPLVKRYIPFSNLVDSRNIVDLADEWLYNHPDFLNFPPAGKLDNLDKTIKRLPKAIVLEPFDDHKDFLAYVSKERVAKSAKKRFIYLGPGDVQSALICFLAAPGSEKGSLSLYFEHHANLDKDFFDDVTEATNTWTTELHLSFYQLVEFSQLEQGKVSKGILWDCNNKETDSDEDTAKDGWEEHLSRTKFATFPVPGMKKKYRHGYSQITSSTYEILEEIEDKLGMKENSVLVLEICKHINEYYVLCKITLGQFLKS